jgi:hypothetical protein
MAIMELSFDLRGMAHFMPGRRRRQNGNEPEHLPGHCAKNVIK